MPNKLSLQDMFNVVWNHFVVQGNGPSINEASIDGECLYRGANGHKCAIGLLIPDELYEPGFEKSTLYTIRTKVLSGLIDDSIPMVELFELQACHDVAAQQSGLPSNLNLPAFTRRITVNLKNFAEQYGLKYETVGDTEVPA